MPGHHNSGNCDIAVQIGSGALMNYLLSVGIQLLKASPQPSPGLIVTGEEPKLGHLARALHHQA